MKHLTLTLSAAALAVASMSATAWWQTPGPLDVDELRKQHQTMADQHAKAVAQMLADRDRWTGPWSRRGMTPGGYGPVAAPGPAFGWEPPAMPDLPAMPQMPSTIGAMPAGPDRPEMPTIGEHPMLPTPGGVPTVSNMTIPEMPKLPDFGAYRTRPDGAVEGDRAERKARLEGRRQQAKAEAEARREALRNRSEERRWMNRMRHYGYGYLPMPARFMPLQQECAPAPAVEQSAAAPASGSGARAPSVEVPTRVPASAPTSAQVN
jgi:hypothetical protein